MKKQALILSILVALSSAAPVVAMDNQPNNQSTRARRFERAFSNLFRFDRLKHAFRRFGQAADAAGEFKENIDTMVGDQKENTNSAAKDAKNAFDNMAADLNNSFNTNIPGAEKIANDRNNHIFKLFLLGIGVYALCSFGLNLFGQNNANQQA